MSGVRSLDGYQVIRRLPNGRWEVKNPNGRMLTIVILNCRTCRKINVPSSSFNQTTNQCLACTSVILAEREAVRQRDIRLHRIKRLAGEDNASKRRQRIAALAKPIWRDKKAIGKIYKEARAKTKATGIPHHVDHYYPIQGDWCCGLHVHQNLRILPMRENCSKNNGHPMGDSPALQAAFEEMGEVGLARARREMWRKRKGT